MEDKFSFLAEAKNEEEAIELFQKFSDAFVEKFSREVWEKSCLVFKGVIPPPLISRSSRANIHSHSPQSGTLLNKTTGDQMFEFCTDTFDPKLWKQLLIKGKWFKKYFKLGNSHDRFVYCSKDLKRIYWSSTSQPLELYENKNYLRAVELVSVVRGCTSPALQRAAQADRIAGRGNALQDLAFTLVGMSRSLDLSTASPKGRDDWARAFQWLVNRNLYGDDDAVALLDNPSTHVHAAFPSFFASCLSRQNDSPLWNIGVLNIDGPTRQLILFDPKTGKEQWRIPLVSITAVSNMGLASKTHNRLNPFFGWHLICSNGTKYHFLSQTTDQKECIVSLLNNTARSIKVSITAFQSQFLAFLNEAVKTGFCAFYQSIRNFDSTFKGVSNRSTQGAFLYLEHGHLFVFPDEKTDSPRAVITLHPSVVMKSLRMDNCDLVFETGVFLCVLRFETEYEAEDWHAALKHEMLVILTHDEPAPNPALTPSITEPPPSPTTTATLSHRNTRCPSLQRLETPSSDIDSDGSPRGQPLQEHDESASSPLFHHNPPAPLAVGLSETHSEPKEPVLAASQAPSIFSEHETLSQESITALETETSQPHLALQMNEEKTILLQTEPESTTANERKSSPDLSQPQSLTLKENPAFSPTDTLPTVAPLFETTSTTNLLQSTNSDDFR
eukprot:GCRY01001804.1.p1 GENE.GCRY01001804.1~~GCRY01001804.1.p1  ORF type:complete len:670 (+),score=54.98 GCRY01001804.1:196-2205(+)